MDNNIKKARMEKINFRTNGMSKSDFISLGKELQEKLNRVAPVRLNHASYEPPNNNGHTAPLVITGDKDEFSYLQFEMIAFLNDLNVQPCDKEVHSALARHERSLKYQVQ